MAEVRGSAGLNGGGRRTAGCLSIRVEPRATRLEISPLSGDLKNSAACKHFATFCQAPRPLFTCPDPPPWIDGGCYHFATQLDRTRRNGLVRLHDCQRKKGAAILRLLRPGDRPSTGYKWATSCFHNAPDAPSFLTREAQREPRGSFEGRPRGSPLQMVGPLGSCVESANPQDNRIKPESNFDEIAPENWRWLDHLPTTPAVSA